MHELLGYYWKSFFVSCIVCELVVRSRDLLRQRGHFPGKFGKNEFAMLNTTLLALFSQTPLGYTHSALILHEVKCKGVFPGWGGEWRGEGRESYSFLVQSCTISFPNPGVPDQEAQLLNDKATSVNINFISSVVILISHLPYTFALFLNWFRTQAKNGVGIINWSLQTLQQPPRVNRWATCIRQASVPVLPTGPVRVGHIDCIHLIPSPLGNSWLGLTQGYQLDAHSLYLSGNSTKTQLLQLFNTRHSSWIWMAIFRPCGLLITRHRESASGKQHGADTWRRVGIRDQETFENQREKPGFLTLF